MLSLLSKYAHDPEDRQTGDVVALLESSLKEHDFVVLTYYR